MVALNQNPNNPIYFIFCGDGPGRSDLMRRCIGMDFVRFFDLKPAEELPILLGMADLHLLPQRMGAEDLVMPSKLAPMLASGRPVLACANFGTQIEAIVKQCGLVVEPENSTALYSALLTLAGDQSLRVKLGHAAQDYARKNLNKDAILLNFEAKLKKIVN
jgi:colanic acid biosynthesis glycosyl transferase WcaI